MKNENNLQGAFRTTSSVLGILCPIFSVDAGMYISWQNVPLVEWILFHSRHDLQIARHVSSHAALPCTVHISGANRRIYTLFIHVSLINLERRFSTADLHSVFTMIDQNWCYFYLHHIKNRTKDIYIKDRSLHLVFLLPNCKGWLGHVDPLFGLESLPLVTVDVQGIILRLHCKTQLQGIYKLLFHATLMFPDRWEYTRLFHAALMVPDRWEDTLLFHATLMLPVRWQ